MNILLYQLRGKEICSLSLAHIMDIVMTSIIAKNDVGIKLASIKLAISLAKLDYIG